MTSNFLFLFHDFISRDAKFVNYLDYIVVQNFVLLEYRINTSKCIRYWRILLEYIIFNKQVLLDTTTFAQLVSAE